MRTKLTKRQYELLYQNIVDVGADPDAKEPARSQETKLIADLEIGNQVTVTKFLIDSLIEFSDRDTDIGEQRMYKNLLSKVITMKKQQEANDQAFQELSCFAANFLSTVTK